MSTKKWFFGIVGLYLSIVLIWFALGLLSAKFEFANKIHRTLIKPALAIVVEEKILFEEVTIDGEKIGVSERYTNMRPDDLSDVGVWVFLLEGYPSIRSNKLAIDMGLDIDDLESRPEGSSVYTSSVSVHLNFSVLPLRVVQRKLLFIDFQYLKKTFRPDCPATLINNSIEGQFDKEFRASCTVVA